VPDFGKDQTTRFRRRAIVAGVAAAVSAGSAGLSWSAELEEVVVTARQRAESSQDIPMMVQSISGEDLQKQGITTLEDFRTSRVRWLVSMCKPASLAKTRLYSGA